LRQCNTQVDFGPLRMYDFSRIGHCLIAQQLMTAEFIRPI